ncbi:hypothetical protein [Thermodesulfitimonas sp.]
MFEELLGRELDEALVHLKEAGFCPEVKVTVAPKGQAAGRQRVVRLRLLPEEKVELLVVYDAISFPGNVDCWGGQSDAEPDRQPAKDAGTRLTM